MVLPAARRVPGGSREGGSRARHELMPVLESGPARPARLYWICQVAGWGGFLAYVLGGYLAFADRPRTVDIASIVMINGLLCPALTHGLRSRIHQRGWMQLRLGTLIRRMTPVVL